MTAVRLLLLSVCLAGALSPAAAEQFAKVGTFGGAFARIPVDARGEAMGLATTVNPVGPTAFWWNPAPLPEGDRAAASYTIRDYAADLRWRPLAIRTSRGNLTFGYLWGRLSLDPMLVRTAYEPDGNGATFGASSNLHQFSGAADLVPWLAGRPTAWAWTLGANARYHHQQLAESTMAAWDADLGTSVAWTAIQDPALRLRVHGAAMMRNALRSEIDYDEVTSELPRYYHLGAGVDVTFMALWPDAPAVTVTVSHVWRRDLEDIGGIVDNEHLGIEVLVGGVAALRMGYRDSTAFVVDDWSWGAGLRYRFEVWWGIHAAVDYAATDLADGFGAGSFDHWTLTAGVDLP